MRYTRAFTVLASLAALVLLPPADGRAVQGYLEPVAVDGMVFPVARTDWYSVINLTDDWHAPRFRKTSDGWKLTGRHQGNDIFAEPGTPVFSVTGGYVERTGWLFYSGWRAGIRGDDGRYWFYAHLERYAPGLEAGDRVEPGTVLGSVGNTGYGDDPGHDDEFIHHLHLQIQEPDGTWINPYPLMKRLYEGSTRGR